MFAVISIPDFSLQALLRHEPELRKKPVALVDDESANSPVWQVTEAGRALGVLPGITSTQAKARCATVIFRRRLLLQEELAQETLLGWAYAFAAYIESTAPGVCTVDLRGLSLLQAEDLPKALETWARQMIDCLESSHLSARVGLAASPALALQATHGDAEVNLVLDPARFWRQLPVAKLCHSANITEILGIWGISSVAEFLALGKANIAVRLGAEGLALYEVAQTDTIRPLHLTVPKQAYEEYFEFETPTETLEPLLFIIRRLLDQLTRRVTGAGRVIGQLTISLKLDSGQIHERILDIPAPTGDIAVLFRVLHNYLETVRTSSPVAAISMRSESCPAETQQFELFETAVRDPNRFYETLASLSALLGPNRVGTPVVRDSFRPDDFILTPVAVDQKDKSRKKPDCQAERGLPLRRFRPPLPATVQLREGQPAFIGNSRFHSSVRHSQGPYRASGEWWENVWTREEWDIETHDGGLYRIFRNGGDWFVEGTYD